MAHRRNQRGRAYGPPRSSAPLLSSISQPPDLAWGAGCPEGKLPKRRPLTPGNRTLAPLLERQGLERIPAAPGRKR